MFKKAMMLACGVCALTLNGCAIMSEDTARSNVAVASAETEADNTLSQLERYRERPVFVERDGYWLGDSTPIDIPFDLPAVLHESIQMDAVYPVTIQVIASEITERTGIRTRIASDVISSLPGGDGSSALEAASGMIPAAPRYDIDTELMGTGREKIAYSHDGPVKDFLDYVAARYNISWEFRNNTIVFSRYVTRTFRLNIMDTQQSLVSDSGAASPDGTGGTQQLTNSIERSIFDDVSEAVAGLLTANGTINVSRSTGAVVVTDTASRIRQIEQFIESENNAANRQVAINMKIYSVVVEEADEFDFSLDVLYDDEGDRSYGLSKIGDALGGQTEGFGLSGTFLTGGFEGSGIGIEALSLKDNVSTVFNKNVVTLNNRTKSIEATRTVSYLREVKTSRSESGDSIDAELDQQDITFGVNFVVTPRILDDDRMIVDYSLDLKDEIGIFEREVGDVLIEQPEYTRRKFMDDVIMRSGQSLIMTGLDIQTNQYKDSGVGESWFKGFGGGRKDTARRELVVIVMTPMLIGQHTWSRTL